MSRSDLIVLSAVLEEAEPTLKVLENLTVNVDYYAVGVGPINAAITTMKLLSQVEGKTVLVIGSCGCFHPITRPYLVVAREVHWLPTCERTGIAKRMQQFNPPIALNPTIRNLPQKTILTSSSISFDSRICHNDLAHKEELVENMEAYPIAKVLHNQVEKLIYLFGITNQIGPKASDDWATNRQAVAKLTSKYMQDNTNLIVAR